MATNPIEEIQDRGFRILRIETPSDSGSEKATKIEWRLSRIEGGFNAQRREYGAFESISAATEKIDEILGA